MAIRSYGPGKFDTIIDSYVYELSLNGADDEAGSVTENGIWYGLMRGLKVGGQFSDFTAEQLNEMNASEKAFLRAQKGAIISENDQGFVTVDYYKDKASLEDEWATIMYELSPDESDEEEEY